MVNQAIHRAVNLYARTVYGFRSRLSQALLPPAEQVLPDNPIPESWVEEGKPVATTQFLTESGDGGLVTGVWHCTAGRFRWIFNCDEVIHVLDGGVEVEHEGKVMQLGPGSVVFFPVGAQTRWTVKEHVRKLFVHRHPAVFARKLVALAS